jgi:hypothetical protein
VRLNSPTYSISLSLKQGQGHRWRISSMDSKQFRKAMAMLFVAFGKPIDTDLSDTYYLFFEKYEEQTFKQGVVKCVENDKFFPKVADLLNYMIQDEALECDIRADILRAVGKYGIYSVPSFKYQISHAIAEDIGWVTLCMMKPDELNNLIHFKYDPILSEWRNCQKEGREFLLPSMKCLLSDGRRGGFKKIGDSDGE